MLALSKLEVLSFEVAHSWWPPPAVFRWRNTIIPGIQKQMNRYLKIAGLVALIGFAAIGLVFTVVFVGMQFGLFNVRGSNNVRNASFLRLVSPEVAKKVEVERSPCDDVTVAVCDWHQTPQWEVVKQGLIKDQVLISRVAAETGVSTRLIAAVVIPEQIRFFTAEREVFKRYFEPLKILGSLSQFSLGVSGIKQETAVQIEQHANDPTSPFYPGDGIATLIAYNEPGNHDEQLYQRLTNEKDHYYSYLYTAIFIKEVQMQWQHAGYSLTNAPGAVITLFNIGFEKSHPNPSPQTAGAPVSVGGTTYTFGELGEKFYLSSELSTEFPK